MLNKAGCYKPSGLLELNHSEGPGRWSGQQVLPAETRVETCCMFDWAALTPRGLSGVWLWSHLPFVQWFQLVCCCTHASGWMEEMVEELFRVIWQLKSFKREIGGFCFLEQKTNKQEITSIYANCVHTVDTCAPSHTLSLSWAQPGSH